MRRRFCFGVGHGVPVQKRRYVVQKLCRTPQNKRICGIMRRDFAIDATLSGQLRGIIRQHHYFFTTYRRFCTRVIDGAGRGAGGYFSGSRLALAQSCSRRHHAELASGCGSYRLIARGDCVKTPYVFCGGRGWWRAYVLACGLSGHGGLLRSPAALRPLCAASANSLKTFSKKCLTEIAVLLV